MDDVSPNRLVDSVQMGVDVCVGGCVGTLVGLGGIFCFDGTAVFGVDVNLNYKNQWLVHLWL